MKPIRPVMASGSILYTDIFGFQWTAEEIFILTNLQKVDKFLYNKKRKSNNNILTNIDSTDVGIDFNSEQLRRVVYLG